MLNIEHWKAKKIILFFALYSIFYILYSPLLWSLGIQTITGKIHIDNVPVGVKISLNKISGKVYRVTNTSEEPWGFEINFVPPGPGDQIGGYEPLPNFNWVKLERTEYQLAPGQEALIDIFFDFPDDESLLGKSFVCFIASRNIPRQPGGTGMGISVEVKSKFTMVISPDKLTAEQRAKAEEIRQRLEFNVVPAMLHLDGFPKGEAVNIKKFAKKTLKVINPNDEPMTMIIMPVPAATAGMKPREEFIEGSLEWIKVEGRRFSLDPNTIFEIPITINVPKEAEGAKFMFVVKVTLEGFDVPVNSYARIYVVMK